MCLDNIKYTELKVVVSYTMQQFLPREVAMLALSSGS